MYPKVGFLAPVLIRATNWNLPGGAVLSTGGGGKPTGSMGVTLFTNRHTEKHLFPYLLHSH
jgi:hypothetical protein